MTEFTEAEVKAAATVLYTEGSQYGWFRADPSFEEFLVNDPIGGSEFGGIIERILKAAREAIQ